MESYMLVLYVTLNQEEAIRHLFCKRGWKYVKEEAEVAIIRDGIDVDSLMPQADVIVSREEKSIHLEISCLEDNRMKCTSTNVTPYLDSITEKDIQDNCSEANIHYNGISNDIQSKSSINSIQDEHFVNSVPDTCIVNNINEHLFLRTQNVSDSCNTGYQGYQDCQVEIGIHSNNSTNYESDISETDLGHKDIVANKTEASENSHLDLHVVCCKSVEDENIEENSLQTSEIQKEQSSRDQLNNLISRGKLLSIENKKRLNSERKALLKNKTHPKTRNSLSTNLSKKRPIFCAECKVTFTSQKRYDTHKARNNGQCVFACMFCDKVFLYRKSRYDLHVRSAHSKERPYKCDVCQKGYVTSDKLKIHKRIHTGEKPCVCEECGKAFYSRGDLSTHREYHHISKERQDNPTCDICNMTFCNQRYLAYHKNVTHSSKRNFHCQICVKSFKSNSSLRRHLKYIHSESKKYKCDACEKSFKTAGSLKKHKVRHVGDRSYFCSECNKGFYEKAKLDQHYRTHTGEKPYKCHLCDYKCALSGNLSKHMKTHYRELTNAVM